MTAATFSGCPSRPTGMRLADPRDIGRVLKHYLGHRRADHAWGEGVGAHAGSRHLAKPARFSHVHRRELDCPKEAERATFPNGARFRCCLREKSPLQRDLALNVRNGWERKDR